MADADLATPRAQQTNTTTTATSSAAATAASTNSSANDAPALKAVKDKNCPFCRQAFTSSSLGRHLDLYIRPKNPKAPDGIHNVDEIRRLRGAITRRQAKGSVSRRADSSASTPHHQKHSVGSDSSGGHLGPSPSDDHDDDQDDHLDDDHLHPDAPSHAFRDVSWGAARRPPARAPDGRRDAARLHRKAGLDARRRRSSDDVASTGAAAEMALRELLHSVREASTRAASNSLFDVDPCTLNFPSLCLHMLPAPATLLSPTPFATSDSWSITPPGQKQFDALNRHVRERLLAHQRQRHLNSAYPTTANSPLPTPPLFDPDPQKLFHHIADAYQHWSLQPEATRQEHWHMEVLRCYARANEARRDAEIQLQRARREIEYLKTNRSSAGFSDFSPVNITLGTDTAKELAKQGMDFRNWDFDRLIDKWKALLRENAAAGSGLAAQRQLPGADDTTRSASMASLPPNQIMTSLPSHGSPIKVETILPFSAPSTVAGGSVSDHIDAECDDDNADSSHDMHQDSHAQDIDAMTQQHQSHHQQQHQHQQHQQQHQHQQHGMPLQPTPMHHSQQLQSHMQNQIHVSQAQAQAHVQAHAHAQAQAQAQAQAHAQAQAQAWAAARQHMNQSRNQDFRPHQHQHQQLSPHLQHMSATNSRRPSVVMMDPHAMNLGLPTGMEGMDDHQDQFLRMDMGLPTGFGADGRVTMGT